MIMATEYKFPYSASEINEKLKTVDEIENSLQNDYYTSTDIDTKIEEVNDSISEINTSLEAKANLVDGKVPLEQLPDDIGGGVASWNDLKDKPFYDESLLIELPADTSNCTSVTSQPLEALGGIGFTFIKVSDDYFSAPEETFGALIKLENDGSILDFIVEESNIVDLGNGFGCLFMGNGFYPLIMNVTSIGTSTLPTADMLGEDMIFDVTETGVYFLYVEGMANVASFTKSSIKQIDPKFIPANLDFDLSDYYTKSEIDSLLGDCDSVLDEISILIGE